MQHTIQKHTKNKNDQWYKSGGLSIMTYLVSDYVTQALEFSFLYTILCTKGNLIIGLGDNGSIMLLIFLILLRLALKSETILTSFGSMIGSFSPVKMDHNELMTDKFMVLSRHIGVPSTLEYSLHSLSTSSSTNILQLSSLAIFLEARSRILPGVATMIWFG